MSQHTTGPPPRKRSTARIAAILASAVIGFVAIGMFATAGGLLWGDSQRDAQGFLSTDTERFTTDAYALKTKDLDIDLDGLDALVADDTLGKVRVQVTGNDDKPAFVGIAPSAAVSRYLRESAHAVVEDLDSSPFDADYRTVAGDRAPGAPAEQRFWEASTHGSGTQTLTWELREGEWSVVVMNADGSAGVDAGISAGAMIAWLDEAGWIAGGSGLLLLVLAGGLLYAGVRQPRPDEPKPSDPRAVSSSLSTA